MAAPLFNLHYYKWLSKLLRKWA